MGHWQEQYKLREMSQEPSGSVDAVFVSCTTGYGTLTGFFHTLLSSVKGDMLSQSGGSRHVPDEPTGRRWKFMRLASR